MDGIPFSEGVHVSQSGTTLRRTTSIQLSLCATTEEKQRRQDQEYQRDDQDPDGQFDPVFVHTLVTSRPYEECRNWTVSEWEHYKKHIGERKMTFTESDHSAKKYSVPVSQIQGGECYVVIAYFADGAYSMSEVFQK